MRPLKLVIFDCDGTLVDSQAAIGRSMAGAFTDLGLAYPGDEAVKKVVGLSLHDASMILLKEEQRHLTGDLVAGYKRAFSALRKNDQVYEPLFPGVLEALKALHAENILLGVATGKGFRGLQKTLGSHGILDFFTTLQTADHHPGKPHPSMLFEALRDTGAEAKNSLFVGDTTFDIEMGRAAGVATLGVAWGYHDPAALEQSGAKAILEGMDEVVHHALRL